ncbi:MAG TPA: DNA-3-methyladenine glycosylase 2 family protein [Candidatus Dormibacteraeota bacterium]|nr:DNA-3-methyladenine glycosylase 2 family protein [Candidatus Dormibacteraeota bacterium]
MTSRTDRTASGRAVAEVARRDPVMAAHIARVGAFAVRPGQGDYFAALVRSILYQQLAGKAAAAIHARFVVAVGGSVTPAAVLATTTEALRGAGLSSAKTLSILDLATRATDGSVPLDGIEAYEDDEIVSRLAAVRGIGRWTAEMFLLFELRRLNVWPVGDLGVRRGWQLIYDLEEMPSPKELEVLGEKFRPYRSIPAWYSWQAVHIARGDPG